MTKASDRILEMLERVALAGEKRNELAVILSEKDHVAHEAEAKKDGTAFAALDAIVAEAGWEVVTLYGGKVPSMVVRKAGLLWMAEKALGEAIADAKASRAAVGDVRDPARRVVALFNDIVLAKGNRLGPQGEVLLG